jgi:hypothetical protein
VLTYDDTVGNQAGGVAIAVNAKIVDWAKVHAAERKLSITIAVSGRAHTRLSLVVIELSFEKSAQLL